jgi:hypothetical protein
MLKQRSVLLLLSFIYPLSLIPYPLSFHNAHPLPPVNVTP